MFTNNLIAIMLIFVLVEIIEDKTKRNVKISISIAIILFLNSFHLNIAMGRYIMKMITLIMSINVIELVKAIPKMKNIAGRIFPILSIYLSNMVDVGFIVVVAILFPERLIYAIF